MSDASMNYCKKDMMSICTANGQREQSHCSHYEPSCLSERCLFLVFDEYCVSLRAQIQASAPKHAAA